VNHSSDSFLSVIVERLRREGMPNFYGVQRFGREGNTAEWGLKLLRGERLPRRPTLFLRKLALSAVQSWLFNDYLATRLQEGLWRTVVRGDVMAKWPTGGLFVAEDLPTEQARFDRRETVSTGPIFGYKMFASRDDAAAREAAVLARANLTLDQFRGQGKLLTGTRRHNLVYIEDLCWSWEPSGLCMAFSLPAGSYATVLLREIMKTEVEPEPSAPIDDA
jgi:tRNA pseudouridine13 synthase